ncbi:permease [Actinotalea fermentans]|uniref:Permease n=1 Tax=Actinotalea fermentans TaxID=43671 RepID=A0A511YYM0_9CELL|nr:permease [Actinotalea fermentans]KGM17799.1 membrane protein [Actinotalea fermentans ATCC 43279 = JCM 9966 = DSM 3133]GEN80288.1 permease [Actinotalea fermentans]
MSVTERLRVTTPVGRWVGLGLAAAAWAGLYALNEVVWTWLVGDVVGADLEDRVPGAVHFFLYDVSKIFLLLSGLMFVIGLARASLDVERARAYLEGRGLFVGLVLAVVLGAVTPFCSCSSIPLFMGFVAAGIPLSVTLTFLVASPLISEIAAIMIGDQFGWGIAAAYVAAGAVVALLIGWVFSRLRLDRWVEDMVFATRIATLRADGHVPTWAERIDAAKAETREIFGKVWKWVLVGVAIGAAIHGWVPAEFFADVAGADNPLAVPIVTLAGMPLYVNGAGVVPIAEALWSKGMPLGTVMAFTMSAIALSIPEAVMLRRVLKPPLLAIFFGAVVVGIVAVGYFFNAVL